MGCARCRAEALDQTITRVGSFARLARTHATDLPTERSRLAAMEGSGQGLLDSF